MAVQTIDKALFDAYFDQILVEKRGYFEELIREKRLALCVDARPQKMLEV